MATRKVRRSSRGKTRKARKSIQKRKLQLVNTALKPFAQKYITKLRYVETRALSTGTNGIAYYNWNLNSVYDPNQTGTGHQPYGFDQLSPIYNRYRVISVRYRVTYMNTNGTNMINWAIPSNAGVAPTDVNQVQENPRIKWRMQQLGGPLYPVNGKIYLPSLTGLNANQYMADDRYQATTTASPDESLLLTTGIAPTIPGTEAITANVTVELDYLVEFFDPKTLAQS